MRSIGSFDIGPSRVGGDAGCFVIGEVAQSHDGSLGMAHAFVDLVADAGAHAVKFQTHIASAESTPAEPWRVKFSRQDASRYDYWRRMEFTPEQWAGLKAHADDRKIAFLSSPFSVQAVEMLRALGMPAWKMASGEVGNTALLEAVLADRRPVLLSSGMSPWSELDAAVEQVRAAGAPVATLQCTTEYPCPPERIGLNVMDEMRERYSCPVGLSDHSGDVFAGLAAAARGAAIVEVHVAFHPRMFGPDVAASLTPDGLAQLCRGARAMHAMLSNAVVKDSAAEKAAPMRALFTRSVVLNRAVDAGTVLTAQMLCAKKPGTGIPAREIDAVVGRRARRALPADHVLTQSDLEESR